MVKKGNGVRDAEAEGKNMISVIIPAYNAEKTIEKCLESVLQQRVAAEIILADDGSTDGTLKATEAYSDQIRILPLNHGGVSQARNAGLNEAQGEWVMFLDADDTLLPDALEKMIPFMTRGADAACGAICRGNETQKAHGKTLTFRAGHDLMDFVLADPTSYLTIHAWVFRRKEDMPQFDPELRIGEDSDWVLRYLSECAGRTVFIPEPVYGYRISIGSTVHQWKQGREQDFLKMMTKIGKTPVGKEKNWPLFVLTNYLLILTHVVFHPGNPSSRSKQFNEAHNLRREPMIEGAFEQADLRKLGIGKRIVLECLKHNRTKLAYKAIKLRQWENERLAGT